MARARLPDPNDITAAVERKLYLPQWAWVRNAQAETRVYDRTSGNFKAIGWACSITIVEGLGQEAAERQVELILRDEEINRFSQTTL